MKYLRKLFLSLSLICLLAATAFAGETNAPPCAPGEVNSPPCVVQPLNDDVETAAPPASPAVDVTDITDAVMWALSLF